MNKKLSNYLNLLQLSYDDAVGFLLKKYGPVKNNYFKEKSYKRLLAGEIKYPAKNKISRTQDGLYCHHIEENKYLNINDPEFCKQNHVPFEAQKAEKLVYCDLIEHYILHVLITIETNAKFGWPGVRTYFIDNIVRWYVVKKHLPTYGWQLSCYKKAYLSKTETKCLFNETKKFLPNKLAHGLDIECESSIYSYEHEDELQREYEDQMIRFSFYQIRPYLIERGDICYSSKLCTYLEYLKNMQICSSRTEQVAQSIIGEWLISEIKRIIEIKDRKKNPEKYVLLDKLAELRDIDNRKRWERKQLVNKQKEYSEFHSKYPNLQYLDIDPDVNRTKIISILYKNWYSNSFPSRRAYKDSVVDLYRDDLLRELNEKINPVEW